MSTSYTPLWNMALFMFVTQYITAHLLMPNDYTIINKKTAQADAYSVLCHLTL